MFALLFIYSHCVAARDAVPLAPPFTGGAHPPPSFTIASQCHPQRPITGDAAIHPRTTFRTRQLTQLNQLYTHTIPAPLHLCTAVLIAVPSLPCQCKKITRKAAFRREYLYNHPAPPALRCLSMVHRLWLCI
eukprot:GGOE01033166.1.p4 GENE.GGOE01033166.1~~GGOE01033166.1.p4  ORF type:complete len:132 (-),score=4.38 GGOE01033166.1:1064-1459(-)